MELIIILIIFVTAFVIAVNTRKTCKYGKQCITQQHPIRRWTV